MPDRQPDPPSAPGVVLDLDGTLVDSVYHHVLAWDMALHSHGHDIPLWRIHAGIGMGSDRLVPWLLEKHSDDAEAVADAHTRGFLDLADRLRPTRGASALLDDLERRRIPFVVATSAGDDVREALLSVLGRDDLPTTDADEVASSKPGPELLTASARAVDQAPASLTLVGDSPWDAEAGARLGLRTIAVRTGGFGDDTLRHAGAIDVVDAPGSLVGRL